MKHFTKACFSALLISIVTLTSCATQQQNVTPSNPNRKFTIENNIPIHIHADMDSMTPLGYPRRVLTNRYFIEVLNETVAVQLPYVGRVYMPQYAEGPSFNETYTDLSVERNKRDNGSVMRFKTRHDGITYEITMELLDGGVAYVSLTPNNAQQCRYSGTWDEKQLYDKQGKAIDVRYY